MRDFDLSILQMPAKTAYCVLRFDSESAQRLTIKNIKHEPSTPKDNVISIIPVFFHDKKAETPIPVTSGCKRISFSIKPDEQGTDSLGWEVSIDFTKAAGNQITIQESKHKIL